MESIQEEITMNGSQLNENSQVLSFEFSTITDSLQKKAELELNETCENRKKCLKELKEIIQSKQNLEANTTDEFLLRFLRGRKFRTKDAFSVLHNYYDHRVRYPSVYQNYNAEACIKAMQANLCYFLPFRATDGSAIWVLNAGAWDPEIFSFEECVKLHLLCMDKALQNPVTQICGVTTVVDFEGMSLSQARHLTLQNVKCIISGMQDSLPLRHKAIHVVNNSVIFSIVFAIIKPLLKATLRKRIVFHGENFKGLHQFLSPSVLPIEFGGTNVAVGSQKFYHTLLKNTEEFQERLRYGYTTKNTSP